jgi:hypothetical protein
LAFEWLLKKEELRKRIVVGNKQISVSVIFFEKW